MKKNLKKIDSSIVVSLCAIFISFLTLIFIIRQTNLMSVQQRAAVLPYLEVLSSSNTNDSIVTDYSLLIKNNGLGPAFIKNVNVVYNGKEYEGVDLINFVSDNLKMDYLQLSSSDIRIGTLIPSNGEILHLKTNDSVFATKLSKLLNSDKLKLKIEYASVYDDKWIVTGYDKPKEVE